MNEDEYKRHVARVRWRIAFIIISVVIAIALGIGLFIYLSNSQSAKQIAIKASLNHEYVKEIGEISQIESTAREVSKKEKEEYPVLYSDTSDNVLLVNHHLNDNSVLCVVDKGEVKRCFNNINIG